MWYIWLTGDERDGWYAGYNEGTGRIEISESIWGAQSFPTRSAADNRARRLYDNFEEVRDYEIIEK